MTVAEQANREMLDGYGITGCGCYRCVHEVISAKPFPDNLCYPFVICGTCGNKRCPRAEFHDNECSGSNKSGQAGSRRYPAHDPNKKPMTTEEIIAWLNEPEPDISESATTKETK